MRLAKPQIALFLTLLATPASTATAQVPEPDHTIYGSAMIDGALVTTGTVTTTAAGSADVVASYALGSDPAFGDRFVLRLPIHSGTAVGTVRPGAELELFLDGELAGIATVGVAGSVQVLDLDTSFDDDPELSLGGVAVTEGNAGTVDATFTLTLSRAVSWDVEVDYATADNGAGAGSATAGSDYDTTTGVANVEAGETSVVITVPVFGDLDVEPTETFSLVLSDPVDAVIAEGLGVATGTIIADDAGYMFYLGDTEVLEADGGETTAVLTLEVRSEVPTELPLGGTVAVDFATLDGTATAPDDYLAATGTAIVDLAIPCPDLGVPCTKIQVTVFGDNERESDEDFFVELANPSDAEIVDGSGQTVIKNDEHVLRFIEAQLNGTGGTGGVTGLAGAFDAVVSPDGAHLYATGRADHAIVTFAREALTGALTFVASQVDDVAGIDGLAGVESVAISPDGAHVYAAGFLDDAIAIFERDDATGSLTFIAAVRAPATDDLDGVTDLALSPDGAHLYTAAANGNAVAAFERDLQTGALSFVAATRDGVAGVDGLLGVEAVNASPDGAHIYAVSRIDNTLVTFERDAATGTLTFLGLAKDAVAGVDGLAGAAGLATSADGAFVYAVGELDDAVAVFARDATTGALSFVERKRDGLGGVWGLDGAAAVAISADGEYLYVAARDDDTIAVFERDATSGRLSFLEARRDGDLEADGRLIDGLAGGVALAAGPEADGRHIYVAGTDANGLAAFLKDTIAPDPPIVSSPSHTSGTWSSDSTLDVEWSTQDNVGGSGLSGYALVFDEVPDTDPGIDLTLLHDPSVDPQTLNDQPRPDGTSYFHLRACDRLDNCTAPVHLGPFLIDTVPPSPPGGLISTSHTAGGATMADVIDIVWTSSADATSGLDGYGYAFDQSASGACPQVPILDATATGVSSDPLADGTWYVHICAVDIAGLWSTTATAGPFTIDRVAPTVLAIDSVASTDDGVLEAEERTAESITQLIVAFSEPMADPPGDDAPGDVTNPATYLLIDAGLDRIHDTVTCGTPLGDDQMIPLADVVYDEGSARAALRIDGSASLPIDRYELFVCSGDGLGDPATNGLDGDGDGSAGGDFARVFMVDATNRLVNPNFDLDLAGWQITGDGAVAFPDGDDRDAASTSGSALFVDLPGANGMAQCVSLPTIETTPAIAGAVRVDSLLADDPEVRITIDYYADSGCLGLLVDSLEFAGPAGDTGGGWLRFEAQLDPTPAGAVAARVSFISLAVDGTFELRFDSLFFGDLAALFEDGFESGDFSAWTVAVP